MNSINAFMLITPYIYSCTCKLDVTLVGCLVCLLFTIFYRKSNICPKHPFDLFVKPLLCYILHRTITAIFFGCPTFLNLRIQYLAQTSWTASSEFGTYRLCEQRRFRRACASAQSRQNLRCSLIQAVSQEEPSDRKPDAWPL